VVLARCAIVHHRDGNPANNDPDNPLFVPAHDEAVTSLATVLTAVDTPLSDPSYPEALASAEAVACIRSGRMPSCGVPLEQTLQRGDVLGRTGIFKALLGAWGRR